MRLALRVMTFAALALLFAGAASAQNYSASLDGLQETPPNASPASGHATLTLDGSKMLHIHMEYSGLLGSITASHVHGPAPAGTPAAVKYTIGALPSPIDVVVGPLPAGDESDLNSGLFYLNIHSTVFSGGEIRGQIDRDVAIEGRTWAGVKSLFHP
jgi:hypothetical protein